MVINGTNVSTIPTPAINPSTTSPSTQVPPAPAAVIRWRATVVTGPETSRSRPWTRGAAPGLVAWKSPTSPRGRAAARSPATSPPGRSGRTRSGDSPLHCGGKLCNGGVDPPESRVGQVELVEVASREFWVAQFGWYRCGQHSLTTGASAATSGGGEGRPVPPGPPAPSRARQDRRTAQRRERRRAWSARPRPQTVLADLAERVEAPSERGSAHDDDHEVRSLRGWGSRPVTAWSLLVRRDRVETVRPGQIDEGCHPVRQPPTAPADLDGGTRPVADLTPGPGEYVEERGLADVWVTHQCDGRYSLRDFSGGIAVAPPPPGCPWRLAPAVGTGRSITATGVAARPQSHLPPRSPLPPRSSARSPPGLGAGRAARSWSARCALPRSGRFRSVPPSPHQRPGAAARPCSRPG